MTLHLQRVGFHGARLARQVLGNGGAELRIGDVVRRPGDGGLESAAHFVFALGAGLETRDAALDAELDPLVVTRLEMQAVVVGRRPPVATEERLSRSLQAGLLPDGIKGFRCAQLQRR